MRAGFLHVLVSVSLLGFEVNAQAPTPTPAPKAAPPLRLPFAAIVPEAKFDVAGAMALAATEDAVWIASTTSGLVSRVDPQTNKVTQTVAVAKGQCGGISADFESVFVALCATNQIARIDPKKNGLGEPMAITLSPRAHSFATGVGSVWAISDARGTIARIDPANGEVVAQIYTTPGATSVVFGEEALWVASPSRNTVTRINPHTNLIVETITVAKAPSDIAVGEGSVWTWNQTDGSVSRIDPKTNTVVMTIQTGATGSDGRIVAGDGSIWVATTGVALTRIDARTNGVAQVFTGTGSPVLGLLNGSIWLSVGPKGVWRIDPKRIEATRAAPPVAKP
ncbi:MAG: hypothetical protein ABI672_17625 [Vicinamibacteria bacterium]